MLGESDQLTGDQNRRAITQRPGRIVLNPLAEVGIGVFVAVVIGGRQLMMHILRDRERRDCQEQQHEHSTQAQGAGPRKTGTSRETAH